MSFLQTEIPSPRQAIKAFRERSAQPRPAPAQAPKSHGNRTARVSRRTGVTGLDIESGMLTAVETVSGSVVVRHAAALELPSGIVHEGEVVDAPALGSVLKDFVAEHNLSNRVRIGLANQRIVMRTVDLPPITDDRQLSSAIRFQAQEHVPMPLDQAVFEHQSLGLIGTAEGPRSRVVLVAARRDMVERVLEATRIAGIRLEGLDLAAFAMIRALHLTADDDAHVAYINMGAGTNLAVASGTQCLFTRFIPVGGESMVSDLAARCGLTTEHARAWMRHVGLARPLSEIEGDPRIVAAARAVFEDGGARMASEIRSTLAFYESQAGGAVAKRAIITGTGAFLEGVSDRVARELGIPVQARSVSENEPGAFAGIDPGRLSIAAGLTTTEAPA